MALIVSTTKTIENRYTSSAIGFYRSGQRFLEEYYTLGIIGKAGLGTPHMDGNTRGYAPPRRRLRSTRHSVRTGSPAVMPTSTRLIASSMSATTSPAPIRFCGCGCSTVGAVRSLRG